MTVIEFGLECTVSGVGQSFRGTLREALVEAMDSVRNTHFRTAVWLGDRKIAECSTSCCEWLSNSATDSGVIPESQFWDAMPLVRGK